MPETLTQLTGGFSLPNGDTPRNGRFHLRFSGWSKSGGDVFVPGPVEGVLTAAGQFDNFFAQSTTVLDAFVLAHGSVKYWSESAGQMVTVDFPPVAIPPFGPVSYASLLAIPAPEPTVPDALAQALAAQAGAGAMAVAAASAAESIQPYDSLAAAAAATPPLVVDRIAVNQHGGTVYYQRTLGGLALVTADGAAWEYAGGYIADLLQVTVPVGRNLQSEVDRVACIDTRGDGFVALRLANAYQITVPVVIKSTTRLTIEQVSGASVPLAATFALGADAITVDYGAYYKHGFMIDATNGRCRVALSVFGECEIVTQMGAFGLRTNTPVGPDANGVGLFVWKGGHAYCASPVDPILGPVGPVFRGFPRVGVWTTYGARASIAGTDCTNTGFSMDKADGCAAFFVSRAAVVQIDYSDCSGSHRGIRNGGGFVHGNRMTGNNVKQLVWTFRGGRTSTQSGTFEDCGEAGWPILDVSGEGDAIRGAGEIYADANNFTGAKSDLASATTPGGLITISEAQVDDFHARLAVVGSGARVFATKLAAGAGGVGAVASPNVANAALELIQVADGGEFNGVGVLVETAAAMTRKLRLSNFAKVTLRNSTFDGAQPFVSISGSVTLELTALDVGGTAYFPNGARLSDGTGFDTRDEAVQAVGLGWRLPNGGTFTAAGLPYRFDNAAGDPIVDLPDVVPASLSTPAHFNAAGTGAGDDTAFLNELFAAGGSIKPPRDHSYRVTGAVTIPGGAVIDGELRLVYEGANGLAWLDVGDDVLLDRLRIEVPTATGMTANIGTGYRGGEIHLSGGGNSGSTALTIANTAGLDLDSFAATGGFQRPLAMGVNTAWSFGGRIGDIRIRDFLRGVAMNYLDGFTLGACDISGRNVLATYTPGHNGILASGLRNCTFGPSRIEGAGEHLWRLGGAATRGASYNNTFGDMVLDGPGGSFIKMNADAVAYDFRFGDITAVGRFMTSPGGNRELLRLSHCHHVSFGKVSLMLGDGATYSAQDAMALNDAHDITVAHLHADETNQSILDVLSGQDIGDGLGNGDVYNVHIGGLTGTNSNSKAVVRMALDTGFTARNITIAGMDYASDGPLWTANGTTVVNGPCAISGRLRKTDLATLPAVNNLPVTAAIDVSVGAQKVINKSDPMALQFVNSAPVTLNHKYVIGLGVDPTANADAINAAVAEHAGHGSGQMDIYFPSGSYQIGVPTAWKIGGLQEGSAVRLTSGGGLRFVGNGTVLMPATNKIEMFVQHGAGDIGFHGLRFDNSVAGILQNTAKPGSLTPYAGVAGLGNAANTAIRQYSGADLTLDDCEFIGFNTASGYDGDYLNNAVLVGHLSSRNVKTYGCAFGHLVNQPKTITLIGGRCFDNVDSDNSSGSTVSDDGHLIYVADRAGAAPDMIVISDIISTNGKSSAIKVRKGRCVVLSDFTAVNDGRGLELHTVETGSVSNVTVKLAETPDTNQNCVELTDVGTVELSNMTLDIRGVDAYGLRARDDLASQPWHNRGWRMSDVTVINDYVGAAGKAPFLVDTQAGFELSRLRFDHRGTVAGSRHPIDLRGCTDATVSAPSHTHLDGSPTDGHRLVFCDSACVNINVELARVGVDATAPLTGTGSTAVVTVQAGATGIKVSGREGQGVTVALLGTVASTDRRAIVTDSTVAASGNFGAVVVGGGANRVPVFYDGTNWLIG